jgi:hypothetical protein
MLPKFEQFIRERQYLHNVTPSTVSWHTHNLKWLPSELNGIASKKQEVRVAKLLEEIARNLLIGRP